MDYKYAFQDFEKETMSRALGKSLPISTKHSVELANAIRGKMVSKAKQILEEVITLKQPVRFGRFNRDLGHKKKMGPGRFPVKTAENFLSILKLAESNAQFKGLSIDDLKLIHIVPQKADSRWHYGRQRRRQFKSTHLEIVLEEVKSQKNTPKPVAKKATETTPVTKKKAEVKTTEKKPVEKPAPVTEEKKVEPVKEKTESKPIEKKVEEKKPETKPVIEKVQKPTETNIPKTVKEEPEK